MELTNTERIIMDYMVNGVTNNRDIAREMAISWHTVRAHIRSILRKLGATSKIHAAAIYVRRGER